MADLADGQRRRLLHDLAANADEVTELELDHARLIEAARESNADDEHDPEGATLAFEREQLTAILNRARQIGADLRQALSDLERGDYGVCERCGQPIDPARLEVRPHTRLCIDCARLVRRRPGRPAY
jgi:DnaK suppressor protein